MTQLSAPRTWNPGDIPWKGLGVDYVIEFTDSDGAAAHLSAKNGARKVVLCALSESVPVFVHGINQNDYRTEIPIVSIADRATNCIAPLAKIIDDKFGIAEGVLTIHQPDPVNLENSEWKEVSTALFYVLPCLAGKLDGSVVHVPALELSYVEMIIKLGDSSANFEKVKNVVRDEIFDFGERTLEQYVAYLDEVTDLSGYERDFRSCLFDVEHGEDLEDKRIKIIARFNDYGYSLRCIDMIEHMATAEPKVV